MLAPVFGILDQYRKVLVPLTLIFISVACIPERDHGKKEGQENLQIQWSVSPFPPQTGPAVVLLNVTDKQGKSVEKAQISLEGNMSHPGMVPVFGQSKEISSGRYEIPFNFTMGGDWLLFFTFVQANGVKVEKEFQLAGVKSVSFPKKE